MIGQLFINGSLAARVVATLDAHIGVDSRSKVIHAAVATANVMDATILSDPLHRCWPCGNQPSRRSLASYRLTGLWHRIEC